MFAHRTELDSAIERQAGEVLGLIARGFSFAVPCDFEKVVGLFRAARMKAGHSKLPTLSCGCCRGPEADRCCCHIHQDAPRGLRPKRCSWHAAALAVLAVVLVLAGAGTAAAQGPAFVQLPSGGFVPCDHPLAVAAGLGCGQAIPTAPTPAPVPAPTTARPAECIADLNPYLDPARAARCAAWDLANRPKPALPTFVVGGVYRDATYGMRTMTVLSVALSIEGVPVVTAEYVTDPVGAVFSFRVNAGEPWERIGQ